jgi:hypothetical protein
VLAKHRFALYVACGNHKRRGMIDVGAWFLGKSGSVVVVDAEIVSSA